MIRKVLIANRGEIAVRIAYTLREMGIRTVAVFSDADAGAVHIQTADEAVRISSYLDRDALVAAAAATAADAIHPGYGFLSENAGFAEACARAGIVFIGPLPSTIRAMGDKLEAKRLMREAGVPVVPSWRDAAEITSYPVLVKAVGGGGGKGMRLVETAAALEEALAAASREAAAAFDDERVFIEQYIERPRHIEFQILGDAHGNTVHVFERECSIQRRHQKIVEETPSPAMSGPLREAMGSAAVAAARAAGYRGAGTVEFIVDEAGRFYFLEVNARLQVEHPVTEATTGLDLVREQIVIAAGGTLGYTQDDIRRNGHAIECRIYAEVPEEHFRPATGTIRVFEPPAGPGVRLDSGVRQGSVVGYQFDPMLAKLVAWAPSRDAAIERMRRALDDFVLLGVRNNIDFLHRVVSSADFRAGRLDTGFLDRHPELFAVPEIPPEAILIANHAGAMGSAAQRQADPWLAGAWRATGDPLPGAGAFRLLDASHADIAGERRRFYVSRDRNARVVWLDGRTYYLETTDGAAGAASSESASGEVRALMPGKLLRIAVAVGDRVAKDDIVAVMESMKMESALRAPLDGQVTEIRAKPGAAVDMNEIVLRIE